MGVALFREGFVTQPNIWNRIQRGLLDEIQKERNGEAIDRDLMANLIRMLLAVHLYHEGFEARFLGESSEHYLSQSNEKLNTLEVTSS